jgi:RNA recognition motif-containing protein
MAAVVVARHTFWELEFVEGGSAVSRARAFSDSLLDQLSGSEGKDYAVQQERSDVSFPDCVSDKSTEIPDGTSDSESFEEHFSAWSDEPIQPELFHVCGNWNLPGSWLSRTKGGERVAKTRNGTQKLVSRSIVSTPIPTHFTQEEQCTTVVLRKLPEEWVRETLMQLLESDGFLLDCDFIYLPTNFKNSKCFGYAIINFTSHVVAEKVLIHYDGRMVQNRMLCAEWSDATQGLPSLVEKYRNSAIMHHSVADMHKPLLLCKASVLPFPQPTEMMGTPPCTSRKQVKGKKAAIESPKLASSPAIRSTIVLRKIPKRIDRDALRSILDHEGFAYDFIYVPMDFVKAVCFGFAIVNFTNTSQAEAALAHFATDSTKVLGQQIFSEWSESSHGVEALLDKYRNSKVMQDSVPELYKPMYLLQGQPQPFPSPSNH